MRRLLLCTDLDRTLLPNGEQPESPPARRLFVRLAERDDVTLVYATGRDLELAVQALTDFNLPLPKAIIADVGATIFLRDGASWSGNAAWEKHIGKNWRMLSPVDRGTLVEQLRGVRLQENEKQGRCKISCYVPLDVDRDLLQLELTRRLRRWKIDSKPVWSVDETTGTGLLDILPARAGKLQAIRFIMDGFGHGIDETLFAGDSGNDLEVLESEIASVLVANAHQSVRQQLAGVARRTLYLAKGGYLGMNGNYSAGILEGVAHFWPHLDSWLQEEINDAGDV